MVLQHNLSAINSNRSLKVTTKKQAKSTEKLSSGYKINRAADDAAGLTISEGMRSMVRGLKRASHNAQDGYSLLQTADGALEEVHSVLQRARELSVQAANDTNTDLDRTAIQSEVQEILEEINRIADTTEFNTLKLLDGTKSGDISNTPLIGRNTDGSTAISLGGMQNVDGAVSKHPVTDTSASAVCSPAQLANLETSLTSIVPSAVGAIMNGFPSTFAGNPNISDAIGVKLYSDNSSTLAYVACAYSYDSSGKILGTSLNLSVNVKTLQFDPATDQLTPASSQALQATIAHEMMHAYMDDALPNGMLGATNGYVDKSNEFPGWFTEGMAQCASGGSSPTNNWVASLGLNAGSTVDKISASVQSPGNKLSSGTTPSKYGTGYLACMYLGYLANNKSAVTASDIGAGLDTFLSRLAGGENMNEIIKDISGGQYQSLGDFQRKFGDSASSDFIRDLLGATASGAGSVITGNLSDADPLLNAAPNNTKYVPDFTQEFTPSNAADFKDGGSGGYNGNGTALWLQVGSLGHQGVGLSIDDTHTMALGIDSISVMSFEEAGAAIQSIDFAIEMVSNNRSSIGAYMNRLEHTIANVDNTGENTQAAESRLRDTDMAEEMVNYSANNILAQAGQAMLAQANQGTQGVLSLFQ